jgi:hypothetical protein
MTPLGTIAFASMMAVMLVASEPVTASNAPSIDLAVVVNRAVPVQQLSASELESLFTANRRSWPDGTNVAVFSYAPEDATRHIFDLAVLKMSPEEVARFWLDQRIRGGPRPPRQVPDPALALRLVAKLPGTIAYVPESMVNNTVTVVARIKGGKVVPP